ncbi:MAG: nitroreductase family protein [Anaerolineae bacterium]|nr:nitroreductase family protein [Anaerolineae bacterium]
MEFFELIKKRYSVRGYKPDPIEEDKLMQVLEAARLAPTAGNRQPFRVLVIETKGREEELQRIYNRPWFVQPPLIICVCGVHNEAWFRRDNKSYVDVDAAIVMDHIILAATALDLGTCWIAAFNAAAAREVLNLPQGIEPIVFTPLGYPAVKPKAKKIREELVKIVRYNEW